jgi:hypothetical protein
MFAVLFSFFFFLLLYDVFSVFIFILLCIYSGFSFLLFCCLLVGLFWLLSPPLREGEGGGWIIAKASMSQAQPPLSSEHASEPSHAGFCQPALLPFVLKAKPL